MNEVTAGHNSRELRRGDAVRVRSARRILNSLDGQGARENLPFMPEMLPLIGQVHHVSARADKTCDTVDLTACSREMDNTVHLTGLRCDGSAHGGCQAACLLFFKEEWLEPADEPSPTSSPEAEADEAEALADLQTLLRTAASPEPDVWRCQATALPEATRALTGWKHYVRDVRTRNVTPSLFVRTIGIAVFDRYQAFSRHRLPRWAWIKDGEEQPVVRGTLTRTPVETLGLQPGEIVEVKSLPEIVATLDTNQRNRNLWFDREMVRYCGQRLRVVQVVDQLIDEKTGRMIHIKTPCVILEGAVCVGDYHKMCPRQIYAYFREIWLKRVDDAPVAEQHTG